MPDVAPTGKARSFATHELIVSKTDLKGRITYANDVFLRVSGYTLDEVMGQPHRLIRHPEMPRGIFRLLWQRLEAGKEVFAFINNLAKNGDHYWVLAHVTPSFDLNGRVIGYHSNRRVPAAQGIARSVEDHRLLLAEERRHSRAADAAEASMRLLEATLADRGMTYDEYVWSLIDLGKKAA